MSREDLAGSGLTHLDASGRARMVDVGGKPASQREARARGRLEMKAETLDAFQEGGLVKGDALAVARVAGIQAAKRCSDLIPLCHPLPLSAVELDIEAAAEPWLGLTVTTTVRTTGPTGVEMEALTATSVALLTLYDMAKALERGMRITGLELLEKRGGQGGHWIREE